MKEQAFVTYTLQNSRQPVGQGATEPEIGELAAIIKQDTNESRAQVYCEFVGARLAALVGVQVAAGVFVSHSRGLRFASLKVAEVGFTLADIDHDEAEAVVARYPIEAAKLAVFDAWICNTDRAGNLKANLAESTDNMMIGLDHGGSLLSIADNLNTAFDRLDSCDWPPHHIFQGLLRKHLLQPVIARVQAIPDEAIDEACVLSGTVGSVMLPDQAMLAEKLKWRRDELVAIVENVMKPLD